MAAGASAFFGAGLDESSPQPANTRQEAAARVRAIFWKAIVVYFCGSTSNFSDAKKPPPAPVARLFVEKKGKYGDGESWRDFISYRPDAEKDNGRAGKTLEPCLCTRLPATLILLLAGGHLADHALDEVVHCVEHLVVGNLSFRNLHLSFVVDNRAGEDVEFFLFHLRVNGVDVFNH